METLLRFDGPTWTHSRIASQRTPVVTANTHQCFPTNGNLFLPVVAPRCIGERLRDRVSNNFAEVAVVRGVGVGATSLMRGKIRLTKLNGEVGSAHAAALCGSAQEARPLVCGLGKLRSLASRTVFWGTGL